MDAEIATLEKRRDKVHAIKQGMMQELLTGKIRLVDSKCRCRSLVMLNRRAKFLLVATSLPPVLGAVAVSQFELCESWKSWEWWLVAVGALVLPVLCWALLMYAKKHAPKQLFYIREFERKD